MRSRVVARSLELCVLVVGWSTSISKSRLIAVWDWAEDDGVDFVIIGSILEFNRIEARPKAT
jgi:hypothetical protein